MKEVAAEVLLPGRWSSDGPDRRVPRLL